MHPIHVLPATLADCRAIAQIHVDAWRAAYSGIVPADYLAALSVDQRESMWRIAVERGNPRILVAAVGGRVVGWIAYGACRDEGSRADTGEIWAIYVAPDTWSNGAGRALLTAAYADLRNQGYRHVSLWVIKDNERAMRFYRRSGFAVDDGSEKQFELGGAQVTEVRLVACVFSR